MIMLIVIIRLSDIMVSIISVRVILLTVINQCLYAECHYAESRGATLAFALPCRPTFLSKTISTASTSLGKRRFDVGNVGSRSL